MDGPHMFLVVLLGVISYNPDGISGSVLDVSVRPGDNITLYCDCKLSTPGVYIVWYRNCSHENQPPFVLKFQFKMKPSGEQDFSLRFFTRFEFVKNSSSNSYDLLIMNITDSDEGLYYCGTERMKVENQGQITPGSDKTYGNITTWITIRVKEDSSGPRDHETPQDCGVCWKLLFSLCPAFAVLSFLLSSLVVYHLCHKKAAKEPPGDQPKPETRGQTRVNQDDDVCYAALEIHQASQRPRKKKGQSSDFSTYTAVNYTSRM